MKPQVEDRLRNLLCLQGHTDGTTTEFTRRTLPFCSLVFGSWQFHLTSREAATISRRTIRSQLKELVSDVGIQERYVDPAAVATAKARKVTSFAIKLLIPASLHLNDRHKEEGGSVLNQASSLDLSN